MPWAHDRAVARRDYPRSGRQAGPLGREQTGPSSAHLSSQSPIDPQVSYWMWTPLMARLTMSRWISLVPSKIV